ncbi:MAG: NAD(+)/NADH kinase [Ruminococcus sp.]|nr:NAD(+)/NADH kinase [Ruminococcus sp.]
MKTVIFPNFSKKNAYETTRKVCSTLHNMGFEVICRDSQSHCLPGEDYISFMPIDSAARVCDMIIAVGGDGTILEASGYAAEYGKLLLGINTGRLGFMASMETDGLCDLSRLMSGDYTVENRMMLDCEYIPSSGGCAGKFTALNDVVISSRYAHLADYFISANGVSVSSIRADGVIFSTPTGSTAYALSAGGSILEPTLKCIQATPVCPHSLSSRPMIFSAEKSLDVCYKARKDTVLCLNVDGQTAVKELGKNDRLVISGSKKFLRLIDINGNSFFNAVNEKLMGTIKGM